MTITATELKENLHKYMRLSSKEDIYVTSNGKIVTKLSNPFQDRVNKMKSLFGTISNDLTLEDARKERLKKHVSSD